MSTPELHRPEQTVAPLFSPDFLNGVPGILDPFPTHAIASKDGSDPSVAAASTVHIGLPEPSDPKSENGQSSDLPKVLLDSLGNMGIRSTSHTNAVDPENNSVDSTNVVGNGATRLSGAIVIGTSTLKKGDPPVTVAGVVVSLAPTAMIIGSETLPLPHTQQGITTIAGSPLVYDPQAVAIAGKTITPGSSPTTLSEAVVAIASSGVIVNSKPLELPRSGRIVTAVAGHEVTLYPQAIALDGTTLTPDGSPITLATLILEPSSLLADSEAVIPSSHLDGATTPTPQEHLITSNNEITGIGPYRPSISINSDGNIEFEGSTLRSGAATMAVDGTSISIPSSDGVILNGAVLKPGGAETTINGIHINIASDGTLVIGSSTTLNLGAPIPSTDDVPAVTNTPDTNNATAKTRPTTASNRAGPDALLTGPLGGRPAVASPSTGTSSFPTAVALKGSSAVRSVSKMSSSTIALLSILFGLGIIS